MLPTSLEPGHVLGGRFAIVGLLGSGGTASVYLVVDQLRGERIALKVVHPHLAADPKVQRRLRKEIAAASLLQSEHVLVPWELHELDGLLALTLPYHSGLTLTEHIASQGALPLEDARQLGIHVASALEQAHRQGLLHRDVTANNVMVTGGRNAMLMDFGLARHEASTTRSTGMLGTTGFAAPEVYAGERADPRTDLYGLGVVLYLAVTGRLPFDADNAMGTLQMQLAGGHTPVRELRPDCPDDLVYTIESLLQREREDRPTSAGEVVAGLTTRTAATEPNVPLPDARRLHLAPGPHAVVVKERDEDKSRRRLLRVDRGKARRTLESEVTKRAQQLWTGVLQYMGVHEEEAATPEELLVRAVSDEAHVDAKLLRAAPAVLQSRFVLVEGVSREAALRIAADARSAGFHAHLRKRQEGFFHPVLATLFAGILVVGIPLTLIVPLFAILLVLTLPLIVMLQVALLLQRSQQSDLPVAYSTSLDAWLTQPVQGRFQPEGDGQRLEVTAQPVPEPIPETRGQRLLQRASRSLDALDTTIADLDLPDIVRSDMRSTARDLRERATDLATTIDRLDTELAEPVEDTTWVEPRLQRLRTKQRAGDPVDPLEISRLEGLLGKRDATDALHARLDAQLTTATAGLLEIGATATAARRQLLSEEDRRSGATGALERLQKEALAAAAARQEAMRQRT